MTPKRVWKSKFKVLAFKIVHGWHIENSFRTIMTLVSTTLC